MRSRVTLRCFVRNVQLIAVTLSSATSVALAQKRGTQQAARFQPEVRADFIGARASAAQIGVGFAVPANTYVRLGIVGAAGQAWRNGEATGAARVDGLVRFVLDPLRESRWAPYASGGVGAIYDGYDKWRAVLVGVIGIEGPASGPLIPAIEAGFGGGARIGVVLRKSMPGRR